MKFHFMWTLCFLFTTKFCVLCSLGSSHDVDYDPSDEDVDDLYSIFQEINTDLDSKAKRNQFQNEQSAHHIMPFPTRETARVGRQQHAMELELPVSKETIGKRDYEDLSDVKSQFDDEADAAEVDHSRPRSSMRPNPVSLEGEAKAPLIDTGVLTNILRKSRRKKLKRRRKQRRKQRIRNKIQALQSTSVRPKIQALQSTSVRPKIQALQSTSFRPKIQVLQSTSVEPDVDVDAVQTDIIIKTTQANTATTSVRVPVAIPMTTAMMKTSFVEKGSKQYGFHTFYRDHAAWFGAVIGVLLTISLVVIILAAYKIMQKYRRCKGVDIKDLSFSPFKDHKLDKSPMYIRLSHIQNPKTGSHYVVSVLDDRKDENENEWSSEEEVFNISAVKPGFPSPANGLESEDEDHGMKTPSNPATPATPNTPHTPASDETDRSAFSVSMDSGIESPQGYQITTNQLHNLGPMQPMIPTPGRPATSVKGGLKSAAKQNDHTTKEKLRRERIKDSCDQLRVLLPYIRGRKTDMASILEMCVDYLQIVNSVMPQQLHNQIVDILSKDPSLVPNKDMKAPKGKKGARELESPSARVSSTVDSRGSSPASQVSNGDIKKPRPSVITFQAQDVTKREFSDVHPMMSDKANKRLRIGSDSMLPPNGDDTLAHNSLGLNAGQLDGGISHNNLGSVDDEFGLFNGGQKSGLNKSAFSDVDAYGRSYNIPSTEPYGTQLYNTYATAKSQSLERDSYQVYMDAPLYRYYYNGLHQSVGASAQSRFFSETMDYVNPNSVLSTASYGSSNGGNAGNTRLKLEGGEVIDDLNTPISDGREKIEVTVLQNSP